MNAKLLAGATAMALVVGTGAQAVEATVSVYVGSFSAEFDSGTAIDDGGAFGIAAQVWDSASPAFTWQVDAETNGSSEIQGTGDSRDYRQIAGHATYTGGAFPIGVFVAGEGMNQVGEGKGTRRSAGIEGGWTTNNVAIFGQFGVSEHVSGDDDHGEPIDAKMVRIGGRFYPDSASAITLDLTVFDAPDVLTGGQGPASQSIVSISYERAVSGTPWSWHAGFDIMNYDDDSHSTPAIRESVIRAGATWSLGGGGGSLQDRDGDHPWWGTPREEWGTTYVDLAH